MPQAQRGTNAGGAAITTNDIGHPDIAARGLPRELVALRQVPKLVAMNTLVGETIGSNLVRVGQAVEAPVT